MKKQSTDRISLKSKREIEALRKMPDAEVDFSDLPKQNPNDPKWKNAKTKRQMQALQQMPESEIDTSDLPVLPPEKWANAMGANFRPIKLPVSLRVDADLLAWLKSEGGGYQSRINEILRREMVAVTTGHRRQRIS